MMMHKKVFALALAGGLITPLAALADNGNFTFYGVADLSYDMVNTSNGTTLANGVVPVKGINKRVVSSNVSKFGFKGTEDLGDGLSANWQVEQQINFDDAAKASFASRNTFVNLKSETLGTILFGIHDTPYKFASRKLDMFGDNIGDNRALMGRKTGSGLGFEQRPKNILMYTSPTFSGFNAAIATVNQTETNTVNTDRRDSITSLAVMYDVAPFYASIAHEAHKLESNVTATKLGQDESATRLGVAYRPEEMPFELTAMYEKTTDNLGTAQANVNGHNAVFVGAKYNIGNDAVKLGYVKAGTLGTGTTRVIDSAASQVSLGYDHGLSKRTKLYALYTKISNGKGSNYNFSQSSGADFTTAGGISSGFGTSPSVLSLGVKHTF